MENSSSFRAKRADRLVQPVGGMILIGYSLLMPLLAEGTRFFLIVIGAVAIAFGLLYHFHKVFKLYDEFFEFKKTPISSSLRLRYISIESLERTGASKLKICHMHKGGLKERALYIGMLSKDERDKLVDELSRRIPAPSNEDLKPS